ncbi:uncharacterized protein LOC117174911 [Belonocnema kinseyi]|uniref:uncharacterized protein LOC117174911 n=1 Tax=Belonocnema kinseyi TaxID=2817044 RepID=UPI00143DF12E|nr:uncharacterized protein LOC117174911 [Belonocnema kinseyi]
MNVTAMMTHITWVSLILLAGAVEIQGDPEPMARPMRPKVFSSPEELRRYLELVRDYYTFNGKARYGKRSDTLLTTPGMTDSADTLRMILDVNRQKQLERQMEKDNGKLIRTNKSSLSTLFETDKPQIRDQVQRLSYPYNIVAKYYGEVQ